MLAKGGGGDVDASCEFIVLLINYPWMIEIRTQRRIAQQTLQSVPRPRGIRPDSDTTIESCCLDKG
jgi:hypothetical protein